MFKKTIYPDGPIHCDLDLLFRNWLANLDAYDQVKHADALKDRDILFLGGWRDNQIILEEHILPLYRRLQKLKAEHVQIEVFDTDHRFNNVRMELVYIIENWIKEKK